MEKILVIEDHKDIREYLIELFELSGFNVKSAKNGKEGFNLIMSENPDLVLCDVSMPELDGFELLGAINQRMKDKIIPPFLFLTANSEPQYLRKGMGLGADDYIIKPVDHIHLLKVVRMRLDKRKNLLLNKTENLSPVSNQVVPGFNKLALPNEDGLHLVAFDEIIKCIADRSYCNFHLKNGKTILVSKSMSEFESELNSNGFFKVHKSSIVNIKHIDKYIRGKGGSIVMTDGSLVPVAVRKKDELMHLLKS